jgi:hypothetical protein
MELQALHNLAVPGQFRSLYYPVKASSIAMDIFAQELASFALPLGFSG